MDNFYRSLQKIAAKFGYNFEVKPLSKRGFPEYVDEEFANLFRKYRDKTMVPWGGVFMAYRAAQHIARNDIGGSVVECGVWRGGCALIMAEAMQRISGASREFYLYDTFTGMSEPTKYDTCSEGEAHHFFKKSKKAAGYVDWCYASFDEVMENIRNSPYPTELFHLVKGKVEDSLPGIAPEQIALLRLDTDFYESTRHELIHLYPRLVSGGVLICDDYGFWDGARKAVDEYIAMLETPPFLQVDTDTGRAIGIKP